MSPSPPRDAVLGMLGNREQARIRREARRLGVSVQDMMEADRGRMNNTNPGKLPQKRPGAV